MSNSAPELRSLPGTKHTSGDEQRFLRKLVASTPLAEAPAVAVLEEPVEESAAFRTFSSAWIAHLAQLLHSMYLVTFTEKAQLGAMYSRNGGAIAQPTATTGGSVTSAELLPRNKSMRSSASAALASVEIPLCCHSVTVDERWLGAVTRYCHFTATLDDVARTAMALPELLQVRWTMEEQDWRITDTPYSCGLPEQHTAAITCAPAAVLSNDVQLNSAATTPSGGKLVARVYLCHSRVISFEEAEELLAQSIRKKGSASAQRSWKALVNHHTAYAAYVDSLGGLRASAESTTASEKATDVLPSGASMLPDQVKKNTVQEQHEHGDTINDEALCATISAELRASLSVPKLQALLRQMRKDAAHVEEAEQHRIAQLQLQERMLNAYEHVRALYGSRDTRGRSALSLIVAMQQESRFEDALDIKALLSSLLEIPASGLSATMLREGRVVAEPVKLQPQPRAVKKAATRGKRRRPAEKESIESVEVPSVVVRVTEPSLEPVTDLRGLTDAQLDLVLVRLDRTSGSVKGVLKATAR
ncbi:hypothetical protein ABL78_0322 [Leptomonas seymouri]|uniref:Uncharacterized protein n=1 Tax=Leptomonas seymouri TaxID=5684 RepID=A0A0N1PEF3_LEPSE|nr:hypothetical protein ABL78_0322 [Leptomonas seymouri]|eukprot:KPI90562.1 hypothetical protein ABL78_0322 [Leptomonas seymouri]